MSVLQELIMEREELITKVSKIEDEILQITKQREEFDIDGYCDSYKGGN